MRTTRRREPGSSPFVRVAASALLAAGATVACGGDDGSGPTPEPTPAALDVVSGGSQQDTIGATLGTAVTVRVVDAGGAPVSDVSVSFRIVRGGGSVSPSAEVTGPDGGASAEWTLGPEAGEQRLEISAPGAGSIVVTSAALPGNTAQILVPVSRVTLPASEELSLDASLVDRAGNAIIGRTPSWSSDDPGVATAESGLIAGAGAGTTTVRVTADERTLEIPVRVVAPLAARTLFFHVGGVVTVARGDGADPTGLVGGGDPAWAPDGTRIALHGPGQGLDDDAVYVVDAATGGVTEPAETFMSQWSPAWSPGGDSLAFVAERPAGFGAVAQAVYKVPAAGAEPVRISPEFNGSLEMGGWSPDGAMASYHRGGDIFAVPLDGGDTVQVTPPRGQGTIFRDPVWSPSGSAMALVAEGFSQAGSVEIGVVGLGGLQLEIEGPGSSPAWRPDGSGVAALRPSATGVVPVVYAVGGSGVSVFDRAVGSAKEGPLSWSPDGHLLLYGIEEGAGYALAVVSSDGSWSRRLGASLVADEPAWGWRP